MPQSVGEDLEFSQKTLVLRQSLGEDGTNNRNGF